MPWSGTSAVVPAIGAVYDVAMMAELESILKMPGPAAGQDGDDIVALR